MGNKARRVVSLVLVVGLFFQQAGLAQAAGALSLAGYLNLSGSSALSQDRFRPVQMRYFSYEPDSDNFKILLDKGDLNKLEDKNAKEEAQTLLSYFLVGVALPDDAFWVNLRPDSQDQIIDPLLEKTEVGRIMLEADLQLKKDTSRMTSPQTPEGKAYWDKLYKKAGELFGTENITIPTITRPWIVPGEIIVREFQNSAYVYKAGLKVMLEEDYLSRGGFEPAPTSGGSRTAPTHQQYAFSDPRLKELNQYSTQLIKELIIPKLTKEINSSKRYANLRQVYYSLILSRWFKLRFAGKSGTYSALINTRNLTNLTSNKPWDKNEYFTQYQQSFAKGEYNLKEQVATHMGQIARSYVSGGVKWASSAINTQNGVILKGDVSNTMGMLEISGSANIPLETGLQPAVTASPIEDIQSYRNRMGELWHNFEINRNKPLTEEDLKSAREKFDRDGKVLPFMGLTTIAWIEKNSSLYEELKSVQENIGMALLESGLGTEKHPIVAPVAPASLHMTTYDLIVGDLNGKKDISPERYQEIYKKVREAFDGIGTIGAINVEVKGIVRFKNPVVLVAKCYPKTDEDLAKILKIRQQIENATGIKLPFPFTGHVTLGYVVNPLSVEEYGRFLKVMEKYRDYSFGEFTFSSFDFTYFSDMNNFIPALTKDLGGSFFDRDEILITRKSFNTSLNGVQLEIRKGGSVTIDISRSPAPNKKESMLHYLQTVNMSESEVAYFGNETSIGSRDYLGIPGLTIFGADVDQAEVGDGVTPIGVGPAATQAQLDKILADTSKSFKALGFDVDSTLLGTRLVDGKHEKENLNNRPGIKEALKQFIKKGGNIVIFTDGAVDIVKDILVNILRDELARDRIPLRDNQIVVYADGMVAKFGITSSYQYQDDATYSQRNRIDKETKERILGILGVDLNTGAINRTGVLGQWYFGALADRNGNIQEAIQSIYPDYKPVGNKIGQFVTVQRRSEFEDGTVAQISILPVPTRMTRGAIVEANSLDEREELVRSIVAGIAVASLITLDQINVPWDAKMKETEDFFAGKHGKNKIFRYTLNNIPRAIIGKLVKMFNVGREGKRPPTAPLDSLEPVFEEKPGVFCYLTQDESDAATRQMGQMAPDKVRRIRPEEIIAKNVMFGEVETDIIVNTNPFFRGHVLLVPERLQRHNQVFNKKAAAVALGALKDINRSSYKVAFNSWLAFGSINHLHLQAFDYVLPPVAVGGNTLPAGKMPVENEKTEPLFEKNGVTVSTLPNWMVRTFVLSSRDSEKLQDELLALTEVLYASNQPFNILFAYDSDSKEYKVYVYPRIPQRSSLFGTGVAYLELSGEVLFINQNFGGLVLSDKDKNSLAKQKDDVREVLRDIDPKQLYEWYYTQDIDGNFKCYLRPSRSEKETQLGTLNIQDPYMAYAPLTFDQVNNLYANKGKPELKGLLDALVKPVYESRSKEIYDNATENDLQSEISAVGIEESEFNNIRDKFKEAAISSPMQSLPDKNTGGIDWRELSMSIQPMGSFRGLDFGLPRLSRAEIEGIDVEFQIGQIKNMVSSGISPSGRRVKELVAACAQKGQISAYADDLLACIGDILKLEEEIAKESSVELKEALVLADLGGNYFQL